MTSRALIVAGGDLHPNGTFIKLLEGPFQMSIAADGGVRHMRSLGLIPDCIIGDMDSAGTDDLHLFKDIPVITSTDDQARVDTEMAIDHAINGGARQIVMAGGIGNRFDHSLMNAHLLVRAAKSGVDGVVTDGRQAVFLLRSGQSPMVFQEKPGTIFSLVPLATCSGLTIAGLKWPLSGADVDMSDSLTISNEFTEKEARVTLEQGLALVILMEPPDKIE